VALLVYVLCALTSIACAVLLLRGYARGRVRLLFWSGICFAMLALNNVLLLVDRMMVPERDLAFFRSAPVVVGLGALIYGLIWDAA
jgi:hypothetical protein